VSAFLFALIATALASMGGRDQRLTAALADKLGPSTGLLLTGWLVCALTAGVAAWVGTATSGLLPPPAKQMLAGIALAVAAAEMAWPRAEREPAEPTRSLFAFGIVLAARQIGDGPRFLVFAIAVASGSAPVLAAAGGAMGAAAALTLAWSLGAALSKRLPLRAIRYAIAGLLLLAGAVIAILARGLVG
jgi:putative Ca2+/H+ antiporter (TMEM165/GDT1 family)